MERTHTITLTDEEWAGVTLAFVSRLQELEREEPGMRERSPDEQAVIDWYRKLFQKIHGELQS